MAGQFNMFDMNNPLITTIRRRLQRKHEEGLVAAEQEAAARARGETGASMGYVIAPRASQ